MSDFESDFRLLEKEVDRLRRIQETTSIDLLTAGQYAKDAFELVENAVKVAKGAKNIASEALQKASLAEDKAERTEKRLSDLERDMRLLRFRQNS